MQFLLTYADQPTQWCLEDVKIFCGQGTNALFLHPINSSFGIGAMYVKISLFGAGHNSIALGLLSQQLTYGAHPYRAVIRIFDLPVT